jgi:hypothetical protein
MAEELDISKSLEQSIRDSRRIQQDTNSELNKSINLLSQVNDLREQSIAKVKALNKESINSKDIQKELKKAREKEELTLIKISKLESTLGTTQKQNAVGYLSAISAREKKEEAIQRAKLKGDLLLAQFLGTQLNQIDQTIEDQERGLTIDERRYAAALKSNVVAKETKFLLEDELNTEKDINKSIGITGRIMGMVGKKLGANNDIYGDMVQKARDLNTEGEKLSFGGKLSFLFKSIGEGLKEALSDPLVLVSAAATKAYSLIKTGLGMVQSGFDSLTGTGGPISKFTAPFTNLIKQIPVIGGLLGGLADTFANIIDFAIGATSKIQEFARNLGISFSQAKSINTQFEQIARNSGLAFVTVEKLTNSQLELSQALGVNNILSNEILQDNIQLQEQVGLELESRKQLAQVAIIANTRQTQIFKTITGQVEAVRRSVGVNLRVQDIISKISQLSGVVGLTFAKYPEKLTKSLAITKALGIDFQKLDSIASGLLDFESSLAAEFEAQLITGKDINLGKARQLALDNDLTGLAVELNKQLGSSEEFINMNRIAQESYSKALGMSRDEIADMLRQQEFFAAAGATDLKTFKERVAQMEKAGTLQKDFVSKLSEEQAQYFLSSTATENIASFMEKIRQSFASLLSSEQFKSFLDVFLNKLSDPNFLTDVINKITGFVSIMIKAIAGIVDVADVVGNVFSFGKLDIDNSIPDTIRSYANSLGSVSIGGAVASSQTGGANASTVGAGTSAPATVAGSPQAINLTVQTVVDDHGRKAEQRMLRNPRADIKTGNIQ